MAITRPTSENNTPASTQSGDKLKVMFLSHSHELGGAELALFDMIEHLIGKSLNMEPFFIVPGAGDFIGKVVEKGWKYKVINYGPWIWGDIPHHPEDIFRERMRNMQAVKSLQSLIKRGGFDLVFTNTLVCPWAAIASGLQGVPHIWYVHEYGDDDHGLKFELGRKATLRDIGQMSDLVIANSLAIAERLETEIPSQKVVTAYIPYKIEEVEEQAIKTVPSPFTGKDSLKLVFTGRIITSKGQLEAVEAVAKATSQGADVELCLLGKVQDEAYFTEIKKVIKQNKLQKIVHLTGHISNPFAIINSADVGVVASRMEAYGRVTFEYMLLGKPVIGSASGGTLEMVKEGHSGFLYQPGNSEDLADKIVKYASDRKLLGQHGDNARKKAHQMLSGEHSPDKLVPLINSLATAQHNRKIPSIVSEIFDLPSVIKSYYGSKAFDRKSSLPIRALKKLHKKSPKPVRKVTKPIINQARKIKGKKA